MGNALSAMGRINSHECLDGEHAKCGGEYCECGCHRKVTDPAPEDLAAAEEPARYAHSNRDALKCAIARAIAKARAEERERCEALRIEVVREAGQHLIAHSDKWLAEGVRLMAERDAARAEVAAKAEEIAMLTSPDVIPCPDCGFKFFACYMETHRRKDCDQRKRR